MTRSLTEAQAQYSVVINGRTIAPWNWGTVNILEDNLAHPADDQVSSAQVFGLLLVDEGNGYGHQLSALDTYYTATKRAYFAHFGINLPVSLTKSYVPWWAGKWGNDKYGNKAA